MSLFLHAYETVLHPATREVLINAFDLVPLEAIEALAADCGIDNVEGRLIVAPDIASAAVVAGRP